MTSKDVAEALGITAKELRVYLRATSYEKTDGRYAFSKSQIASLKKGYATFVADREAARAAKAEAASKATPESVR